MHSLNRPTRRDWLAALTAGATLGLIILGVGSRIGMRFIALESGQVPSFSIEGSIAVSLMGAAAGAIVAAIFMAVRTALPNRRWIRAAIFWAICLALALRGLRPISALNVGIFLPLFLLHGALLHTFWCRFYVARRSTRIATAPGSSPY